MKKIFLLLLVMYSVELLPAFAQNNGPVLSSDRPTVKLSPRVRTLDREEQIPTIRTDIIQQFLNRPQLITEEELEEAGYVITNTEQSIFSTKGHHIYVKGLYDDVPIGSKYIIVRLGKAYHSPLEGEEDEVLAYEAIYLGDAVLKDMNKLASLEITTATREIRPNDRLLQLRKRVISEDFYPHSPVSLENAYVIAVTSDYVLIGKYQIVVINKGLDDEIERGHVLKVFKRPQQHREVTSSGKGDEITLPKLHIGSLLVFKVFDSVSYALVTQSKRPIHLLDVVTVP